MPHPLLTRARASGTPITDGETATFLWQGAQPPQLIGDFNGWDTTKSPAWQDVAPHLWAFTLELPGDAYIEYGFAGIYSAVIARSGSTPSQPRRKATATKQSPRTGTRDCFAVICRTGWRLVNPLAMTQAEQIPLPTTTIPIAGRPIPWWAQLSGLAR